MIVVDASAVIEVILDTPAAEAVGAKLGESHGSLHAPHLLDVEVAHVLRRFTAAGAMDDRRGRGALADLADLPISRHPHDFLLPRVWALRHNMSAYDAVYVALAEVLGATLLTRDRRLAATAGELVTVALA